MMKTMMDVMKVEMVDIGKIKPYEKNPRKIPPEAVEKVMASIKKFGFRQPIVVDKDFIVIVGHTRLMAAKKLGMTEVPVHVAENLTDEQVRAYRIADNKTNEFSIWDELFLKAELEDLRDAGEDLKDTALSDLEIARVLKGQDKDGAKELQLEEFSRFDHKCPKCGFEFNR